MAFSQTGGATGPGERQADPGAALPAPPRPGSPGSRPSRALTPRVAGAPRGRARLGGPGPAPHLEPQAGPRPRPPCLRAPAFGSARSAAGPRVVGRQPPSCSPPARREGRSRLYLHKGRAGGAAEPGAPGPPRPLPCAGGRGRGAGALRGRGPRSGQSAASDGAKAGPHPREYARGAAAPPPASPARTWSQVGRALCPAACPGRSSSRNARRPGPPRRPDCGEPSLPPRPGRRGRGVAGRLLLSAPSPNREGDPRGQGQVSGPKSEVA